MKLHEDCSVPIVRDSCYCGGEHLTHRNWKGKRFFFEKIGDPLAPPLHFSPTSQDFSDVIDTSPWMYLIGRLLRGVTDDV